MHWLQGKTDFEQEGRGRPSPDKGDEACQDRRDSAQENLLNEKRLDHEITSGPQHFHDNRIGLALLTVDTVRARQDEHTGNNGRTTDKRDGADCPDGSHTQRKTGYQNDEPPRAAAQVDQSNAKPSLQAPLDRSLPALAVLPGSCACDGQSAWPDYCREQSAAPPSCCAAPE